MSIEEIDESTHTHSHDPAVEDDVPVDEEEDTLPTGADVQVYSRAERKARLALIKQGMKKVNGITRVTLRRSRNILFVIANPEVYKLATGDVYLVFGEAKIEDMSAAAQASALQQLASEEAATGAAPESKGKEKEVEIEVAKEEEEEADEDVDTEGVEAKDIELVMTQANVSKSKAVKALRNNNFDIISR